MSRTLRGVATVGVIVGGLASFAACSGDDQEVTVSGRRDASVDSNALVDGAGDTNAPTPILAICGKYGPEKIPVLVDSLLANVKADCRIGIYFTELPDQGAHFKGCLTLQLGTMFGCPGVSYGADAKENGKACLNMKDAHKNMQIREADFLAFSDDLIAALNASGITDTADVQSILSAIGTTDTAIVSSQSKYDARCTCDGGVYMGEICTAPKRDGGLDGGEGGTDSGTDTGTGDAGVDTGIADSGADADDGD